MGEASRQLPDDFRRRHDHIPWPAMIGMCNRIVHEYLDIDLEIVWEVVMHDLPQLKTQLRTLLDTGEE